MRYFIYQVVKYSFLALFVVIITLYLAKTDKLPRFLPDDVRNSLIDFSDFVLSYDVFSKIYKPFSVVFDFLADDGYQYKYNVLPEVILKRLDTYVEGVDNDINLFVNNPLFESWIIQSLVGTKSQILDDLMKNFFNYSCLVGIGIYSPRGVDIAYSGVEVQREMINYAIKNKKKLVLFDRYVIIVRELKKDVDFIDGNFVIVFDAKLFFEDILNSELKDFRDIYILDYYSTNVLYSLRGVASSILKESAFRESVDVYGEVLNNKVLSYKNIFYVGFIYPRPGFLRIINIAFRIVLIIGILAFVVWINFRIKKMLKNVSKKEEIILRKLKDELKQLPYKDIREKKDINNLFVISTDQSLKYFENFVKTDLEASKEGFNRSLFKF